VIDPLEVSWSYSSVRSNYSTLAADAMAQAGVARGSPNSRSGSTAEA